MYTTSLRSIARTGTRHGPSCRRPFPFRPSPSSLRTFAAQTTPELNQSVDSQPKGRPRDRTRPPRSIAVLGGGLTGLTTAWHLTRALPQAKITIYDEKARMGGWIETEEVTAKAADGTEGTVHFEHAARMIKPQASGSGPIPKWDDLLFFEMVTKLNLTDQLVSSQKDEESVAGFIYYPDHLVGIPSVRISPLKDPLGALGSLAKIAATMAEPVFRDILPSILNILRTRNSQYQKDLFAGRTDMSAGDYYAYRFGRPGLVDKVMSAMVHGITGGDVWKQSMASGFFADQLIPVEDQPITNVPVRTTDLKMMTQLASDKATYELASQHLNSSELWFRDGFSTLPNALADALEKNPNVTIKTRDPAVALSYNSEADKVNLASVRNPKWTPYDKVISTTFARDLARLTGDQLPSLKSATAVSIMVVNIWYPTPQANFPHNGFGYLLPQALDYSQNPECILGVIFDSDREYPLPTESNPTPQPRGIDFAHGTKLTVLMGGHYWSSLPRSHIPTTQEAREMALAAVQRHLHLAPDLTAQATATATLCRDCLPQHTVGHAARMKAAHAELEWGFKGRLAVAGQSYQTPGVLGALRAGRDIALQVAGEHHKHVPGSKQSREEEGGSEKWVPGETGLERFTKQARFVSMERQMLPLRYGSGAWVDGRGEIQLGERGGASERE